MDEDQLVMLRHVKTRWLQLEMCIRRILSQWDVICKVFRDLKKPSDRAIRIKSLLTTESKAKLHFLLYVLGFLMPFERQFQTVSQILI